LSSNVVITLVGNVAREPELRFTPSGTPCCKFSVAVNERRLNQDTQKWEDGGVSFHDVVVWRQLAENVAECVVKGTRVMVAGTLRQEFWDDKDTGTKRSRWVVTATAVGPELTWATAQVHKRTRRDGPPDDEWNSASRTRPEPAMAGAGVDGPPF
jgi:single-strand DNA-binding protein